MNNVKLHRKHSFWLSAVLVLALAMTACGGSGSDPEPPPPPTALPNSLSLVLPATRQAIATDVAFSASAADAKLSYRWDFGDGSSSTLAAPMHRYAKAGSYAVKLVLSNEAGSTLQSTGTVSVADLAIVAGRACSAADSGGWCWQNPLPQGNRITDYAWLDANRGWAVGEAGTILRTQNGGRNWSAQISGVSLDLQKVSFVDDNVGWIAGSNGLMLRTADGGATWRAASVGVNLAVQILQTSDANTAWLADYSGAYITTDGGNSWRIVQRPPNNSYARLWPVSATTVWTAIFEGNGTALARSADAGVSWVTVPLPAMQLSGSRSLSGLQFVSAQQGLVSVYETAYSPTGQYSYTTPTYITADGGGTWRVLTPPPSAAVSSGTVYDMARDGTVFARSGYGAAGNEFTTDFGTTWRTMPLPTLTGSFSPVWTYDSSSRVLIKDLYSGRAYLTHDAGLTWSAVYTLPTYSAYANSIWFFDSREGLVITDDGNSLRTSDGGQTWTPRLSSPICCSGFSWRRMEFLPGRDIGWALTSGQIYRSTDRGRTWLSPVPQSSASLGTVTDYHFVDDSHGWALSPYSSGASPGELLFASLDGGTSWQAVPATGNLAGMSALRFADRLNGVAVGAAGVAMVTADGGATWRPRNTGVTRALTRVVFVDAQTVVAVGQGGTIVRSTDRGQTWNRMPSPTAVDLLDLRFVSARVGHAVGDQGTVLDTQDGGLTWHEGRAPTQWFLRGVFFLDELTGWVVGLNTTILATISGGR